MTGSGPAGLTLPEDPRELAALYASPPEVVRANMVMSLDGAAAVDRRVRALSCPTDLRLLLLLRALADVVLVGAGTVRAEGYGPARLDDELRAVRTAAGLTGDPPIAVVSASMDLDLSTPLFATAQVRPLVLTCRAADPGRRAAAAEVADVVILGGTRVDAAQIVPALRARGLQRILCEGGPTLLAELMAADAVDELCLTLSPRFVVGTADHPVASTALIRGLSLHHAYARDDFLYLRYRRTSVPPTGAADRRVHRATSPDGGQ